MSTIKLEVTIERELFYNADSNYGIYGARPKDETQVKINMYGNVSLKGVTPRLDIGSTYTAVVIEKKDAKYGIGYEIQSIYNDIPQSVDQQRSYLETIISPYVVDAIYEIYNNGEDVIQMFKDDTFDYNKVRGMGSITYEKTKEKVLGNLELQEALIELSKFGLNYNNIAKMVKHYGSPRLVVQKVNENPYILTEVDGFGFIKVDAIALSVGVERTSRYRIESCVEYILDEEANNTGHCWLTKKKILSEALDLLQISKELIKNFIDNCNGKKFYVEDDKVALMKNYMYELRIYENIKRLLSYSNTFGLTDEIVESKIIEAEKSQGFEFTDEQKTAIRLAVSNNVLVLSGKAGCGKTATIKGLLGIFAGRVRYEACALSGKASQRIQESTGIPAKTIHRTLGYNPDGGFSYNKDNPLEADIVVLDEASMINSQIMYSLISAVKSNSKIIIVGDDQQLPPIGVGNVLKDLIDSKNIPSVSLTKVMRQAQKSGILSTANSVRDGVQFASKDDYENRVIGELKDFYFKPYKNKEAVFNKIIDVCERYASSGQSVLDFQVIVPMKQRGDICTKNLNLELQEVFNPDKKPSLSRNGYDFKEGDKIIQRKNNYEKMIFNGTIGTIKSVDVEQKKVMIEFFGTDVGLIEYTQEEMSQIDMAYALTCHSTQGSQWKHVLVGLDYSSYKLLSRQIIYTAMTRAVSSLTMICELESLLYAVRTDSSTKRNTYLLDLIYNDDELSSKKGA